MLGILVGAGILGIIISIVEKDEFPGWGKMIVCVLAASIPTMIINYFVPPYLFIVGLIVGTICAAAAIFLLCGTTIQRALISAGIYFAVQIVLSTLLYFLFAK